MRALRGQEGAVDFATASIATLHVRLHELERPRTPTLRAQSALAPVFYVAQGQGSCRCGTTCRSE
eukprot:6201872-Pleurochrysis_carterae.AAC.5